MSELIGGSVVGQILIEMEWFYQEIWVDLDILS